jgi:GxxExxY protein
MLDELLLREEVYAVMGAAIEVHRELRHGFAEAVYQEALQIELSLRQIPFAAKMRLPLFYKGQQLQKYYEADVCCYERLIVELKAEKCLTTVHQAQLLNYLAATKLQVDLLINFGAQGRLEWKRMVRTQRGFYDPDAPFA